MKTKGTELQRHLKVEGNTKYYCFSQNYTNGIMEGLLAILEKFDPEISKDSGAVIHLDASNIGMLIEASHDGVFDFPDFIEEKEALGRWMQIIDQHPGLVLTIRIIK